jgi:hypothetical protein
MKTSQVIASLTNFLVAAWLGVVLRYAFVGDIEPLSYRHIMHAHSHIAMMGWIFMALFILIVYYFIPADRREKYMYKRLFWANQVIVILMGMAFLIQGYGPVSIGLAGLHVIISYMFAYRVWNDMKGNRVSAIMLRTSLIWMAISTLGLWLLPVVILTAGRNSEFYFMCVQFFLHFQFNGWFIFSILALIFRKMEDSGQQLTFSGFKQFYFFLVVSCLLTYSLAVTWSNPKDILFTTNSVGVIFQIIALVLLYRLLKKAKIFSNLSGAFYLKSFFILSLISFLMKIMIQAAVVIPSVAVISYTIRQFVIGFIHLTLLGAVSGFIIALYLENKMIPSSGSYAGTGMALLITGLAGSEFVLFGQGILLWAERGYMDGYYIIITLFSFLMAAGILLMVIAVVNRKSIQPEDHRQAYSLSTNQLFFNHLNK